MKVYTKNDDNHIKDLSEKDKVTVLIWIKGNILKRKTPLFGSSSYGLKHVMTRATGIYVTNNQFKEAMLLCGFKPVDDRLVNWNFCISKKSPVYHKHYQRKPYCNEIIPGNKIGNK